MTATATSTVTVREATGTELARWDELVRQFPGHRVTHTRGWVQSLGDARYGRPVYLVFEREGAVVGCLPGLLARVGPMRLFGSPRAGWQTVSMGPVFDPARLTTSELMDALVPWLETRHRVSHIEMLHGSLDADAMRAAGFEGESVSSYRATLFPGDERKTFKNLKDSARRNVQRAQRLGLELRFDDDESFVDEHYAQLTQVYARRGTAINFPKRRVLACFRHMKASGNLRAVSVWLAGGKVCIATGMFFVEGSELSLWMWAHHPHYRWYRPTEFMTWGVIQQALAAGCDTFEMMGGGDFKAKFGAELDTSKVRWIRSRPRWVARIRRVAVAGFRAQQSVRGRIQRWRGRLAGALAPKGARPRFASVCVMGDIDLVRALALGGIRSVAITKPGDAARFSRFTTGTLDRVDTWQRPEEMVAALIAYGQSQSEPPVLFYQDDASLLTISRNREALRGSFRFIVPDAELVEALVDKGRFQQLAARHALPVPPALCCSPADEPFPDESHLTFPAIVKPLTRRAESWVPIAHGKKALGVDTAEALRALWPDLAKARLSVLVQSLIPGDETRIESYHVYVDGKGDRVAEFTGRKIRTSPLEFGDSSAVEITDTPDVAELGRDIIARLKLRGVAKLDFKRAPDGRLHLLEINPRFTLWHHPGARAGINIPSLVYGDLVGLARPVPVPVRAGVRWCRVWSDYSAARQSGVGMLAWCAWAFACETKAAIAWDDPLPLVGAAAWRVFERHPRMTPSPDTNARLIPTPVAMR